MNTVPRRTFEPATWRRSLAIAAAVVVVVVAILLPTRFAVASDENKPSQAELRVKLTPMQYRVTQQDGTEPPFRNQYWDNKREGIYVDVVSGEPLFSSTEKYKSGTGWPSFWAPLVADNIVRKSDRKLFIRRTEVRSKRCRRRCPRAGGRQPVGERAELLSGGRGGEGQDPLRRQQ